MNKEDVLELYIIELQPKCWSICSTLRETKEIDTPRTLCFGSAEVYRNQVIADRHCDNIINGGKFVNAKVVPLQFINQSIELNSDLGEAAKWLDEIIWPPAGKIRVPRFDDQLRFAKYLDIVLSALFNKTKTIKECIDLLGQDGIDSKQIVKNKLKELL